MRLLLLTLLAVGLCMDAPAQAVVHNTWLTGFSQPVDLQAPPDGTDRVFVVEKTGAIRVVTNASSSPTPLATPFWSVPDPDFVATGERGLFGIAFHPDYATNRRLFAFYTTDLPEAPGTPGFIDSTLTRVVELKASMTDPNVSDGATEIKVIGVDHPYANHNAGQIQFGPDGHLYVSMGDGGSGGDPLNSGQDTATLLGALLRLDVDGGGGSPDTCLYEGGAYTVPASNAFVDGPGGTCDELYAVGLRNPWRFSFGPDGKLWVGDVGQNQREEISIVPPGGNMGWRIWEGFRCYSGPCIEDGYVFPVLDYPHDNDIGGNSVSGGIVHTGTDACGALNGRYVYADFVSGNAWSLALEADTLFSNTEIFSNILTQPAGFSRDNREQTYVVRLYGEIGTFTCSTLPGVSVKVLLEGAYDAGSSAMRTDLAGSIPAAAPGGTEYVGTPDYYANNPDLTDWVRIELWTNDAGSPGELVAFRSAHVDKDGTIEDFEGGPVRFVEATAGTAYFVRVEHRNHVP
ncbi:MAG: PQQ-dependent sugar dehydrogenase, partial [Bacteroidota bacterium]